MSDMVFCPFVSQLGWPLSAFVLGMGSAEKHARLTEIAEEQTETELC